MIMKIWIFIAALLLVASPAALAQRYDPNADDDDFSDYMAWMWEGNFRPFLEASYGVTQPQNNLVADDFTSLGLAEAKLGYSEIESYKGAIHRLDERYVFASKIDKDLRYTDPDSGGIDTEYTRFGFGNRLGYGYKIWKTRLLLYNQNALVWTKLNHEPTTVSSAEDQEVMERYGDTYRFGSSAAAGVKFDVFRSFYAAAAVEGTVIYPRTVFWEWLGSAMIQYGVLGALSTFSERIVDSSPVLGPLFYFVLKNGASYLFYKAYQDDMNWPFTSETPQTLESFTLSAGIAF